MAFPVIDYPCQPAGWEYRLPIPAPGMAQIFSFFYTTPHMQKRTDEPGHNRKNEQDANSTANTSAAREKAEQDINKDPDMKPDPKSDLDEGELARLGDGENDLA